MTGLVISKCCIVLGSSCFLDEGRLVDNLVFLLFSSSLSGYLGVVAGFSAGCCASFLGFFCCCEYLYFLT